MKLSNKLYDILKWICMIVLPAVGALYFSVASIWHLPYAGEVTATISALCGFLGALLGISSMNYHISKEE